jgi:hypothetical protein
MMSLLMKKSLPTLMMMKSQLMSPSSEFY